MREERLEKVLELLSRYDSMNNIGGMVDYYQLFGFRTSMFLEEIKIKIHNLNLPVLFHSDQINYIPEGYREKYIEMIKIVNDMLYTFSTIEKRVSYDRKILENYNMQEAKRTEEKLRTILLSNSEKYGFEFTREALYNFVHHNTSTGFTRDYKDTNLREMIEEIGSKKVLNILTSSSVIDITTRFDLLEHACIEIMQRFGTYILSSQAYLALQLLSSQNDFSGFTNENSIRENLIQSEIDPRNVNFLIQCNLNNRRYENNLYAYQNIKRLENPDFYEIYCMLLAERLKREKNTKKY